MILRRSHSGFRTGLTILEMMVSMALLAVIMVGLLATFQQTQKALHVAATQTDVFENARGAMQLVCRDLTEMVAYGSDNDIHALFSRLDSSVGSITLPSQVSQRLNLDEGFWLNRANDEWHGIGYYIGDDPILKGNVGVGTLYRFSEQRRRDGAPALLNEFLNPNPQVTNAHRVSDGIVHFTLVPYYVSTNRPGPGPAFTQIPTKDFPPAWEFLGDELPAFVDVEIGVLEPATLKQFQALTNNTDLTAAHNFLRAHVGNIHFFRERVPIRNFINPYRLNEMP